MFGFKKRKQNKIQKIHPELINIIKWQYNFYRKNKKNTDLFIQY